MGKKKDVLLDQIDDWLPRGEVIPVRHSPESLCLTAMYICMGSAILSLIPMSIAGAGEIHDIAVDAVYFFLGGVAVSLLMGLILLSSTCWMMARVNRCPSDKACAEELFTLADGLPDGARQLLREKLTYFKRVDAYELQCLVKLLREWHAA